MNIYLPEGSLSDPSSPSGQSNRAAYRSIESMQQAMETGRILESRAIACDAQHNLIVDMGDWRGFIPREEAAWGIAEGLTRDIAIITRVNKPVCYKITELELNDHGDLLPRLSRRAAQEEARAYMQEHVHPGDLLDVRVTHLESFGCFVDIGCGLPSLIPIDAISISRISHPHDRFTQGDFIKAVVREIGTDGRVTLSHKELLGSWEENAALFQVGETVSGVIRSVEEYGAFVELTPNLAGLAEPRPGLAVGQQASVYIKSIIPEKMKIKLIIVDAFHGPSEHGPLCYFRKEGHVDRWRYSPAACDRVIESVFEAETL